LTKSSGAWRECSLYIRERDKYICQFHKLCKEKGIKPPCGCTTVMQACHKITKGRGAGLKWDERNMFCGCAGSNVYERHNRDTMQAIFRQLWPEDYEYLERPRKPVKMDLDAVRLYYQQKRRELDKR